MDNETDSWRHATVERPVREIIKLLEIGDTGFLENMKDIRERAKQILLEKKTEEEDKVRGVEEESDSQSFKKQRRSTELDRLKLGDGFDVNLPRLRSRKEVINSFVTCSSLGAWNTTTVENEVHVVSEQFGWNEYELAVDQENMQENNDYDKTYDNDEFMFMM